MRHAGDGMEIAGVDGFIRKPVKEGAHALFIGGSDGPVSDAEIFFDGLDGGDVGRVEARAIGQKDLIVV